MRGKSGKLISLSEIELSQNVSFKHITSNGFLDINIRKWSNLFIILKSSNVEVSKQKTTFGLIVDDAVD